MSLLCFCFSPVSGAVFQSDRGHAAPEGAAGAEDQTDRGKHPEAAGRATANPGRASEGAGTEPAGLTGRLTLNCLFSCLLGGLDPTGV